MHAHTHTYGGAFGLQYIRVPFINIVSESAVATSDCVETRTLRTRETEQEREKEEEKGKSELRVKSSNTFAKDVFISVYERA